MKPLALLFVGFLCASPAAAQEPLVILSVPKLSHRIQPANPPQAAEESAPSMGNAVPRMRTNMHPLQRYDAPQVAVRQKAEERAARRQERLAARRWFGLSNTRPAANPVPMMATYSPFWAGNHHDPQRYSGIGGPVIFVYRGSDNRVR